MTETEVIPDVVVPDVGRRDAQDVAQDVELQLVKVAINAGTEERLELVRARLDFRLGQLGIVGGRVDGRCAPRRFEAQSRGREVEQPLFDRVESALGEDVDAVDEVVDQTLRGVAARALATGAPAAWRRTAQALCLDGYSRRGGSRSAPSGVRCRNWWALPWWHVRAHAVDAMGDGGTRLPVRLAHAEIA